MAVVACYISLVSGMLTDNSTERPAGRKGEPMVLRIKVPQLLALLVCAMTLGVGVSTVTPIIRVTLSDRKAERLQANGDLIVQAGRTDANTTTASHEPDLRRWEMLYEVLDNINKHFVRTKLDQREITYGAVRGMLRALNDKYTRFLTPEEYDEFRVKNEGEFFGIGAQIFTEEDQKTGDEVLVIVPIEDNPAAKAGLKSGDWIMKIDGKPARGMAVQAAVALIRGKLGSKVILTIQRKGMKPTDAPTTQEVSVVRDKIVIPAVEAKLLDGGIGWIELKDFNEKADKELERAYQQLKAKGLNGLILDLRNDPGGLLEVAINVASRFVKSGPVVRTEGRSGNEDHVAETDKYWNLKVPVVVIINKYSASASEIVAGAIQDKKLGKVVGEASYGKASVQLLVKLKNGGAMAITTARYLTPGGRDLSEKGVMPDVLVAESPRDPSKPEAERKDLPLEKALELLKQEIAKAGGGKATTTSAASRPIKLAL